MGRRWSSAAELNKHQTGVKMHQILHAVFVKKYCFFPRNVTCYSAPFHKQPPLCGRMCPKVNRNKWWWSPVGPVAAFTSLSGVTQRTQKCLDDRFLLPGKKKKGGGVHVCTQLISRLFG